MHALVSRADFTAEAMCMSLSTGQTFDQLLIQVSALHVLLVPGAVIHSLKVSDAVCLFSPGEV